jgi:glycosyltransferase involved in cell wall biosynthesis
MSAKTCIPAERLRWLTDFEARHGRPLRVLHVGNIANNAYLNAKFLRNIGVDAHVLSQDYFHVMACPEWEEIEITEPYGNDNAPSFSPIDVKTYRRPRWFIQDSLQNSVEIIHNNLIRSAIFAQDETSAAATLASIEDLRRAIDSYVGQSSQVVSELAAKVETALQYAKHATDIHQSHTQKIQEVVDQVQRLPSIISELLEEHRRRASPSARIWAAARRAFEVARGNQLQARYRHSVRRVFGRTIDPSIVDSIAVERGPTDEAMNTMRSSVLQQPILAHAVHSDEPGVYAASGRLGRAMRAVADFASAFPGRLDKLSKEEVQPYLEIAELFRLAFEPYDIIQCYATHPIFGYLAGNKPYIAYEHGTLRTFTMENSPLHRLTALGYRRADHVFITNGDCLEYAKRLGITNYSPMIHPVDVEQHRQDHGIGTSEMKRRLNADVLLFCPLRHDWAIKGTDIHIKALPIIRARVPGRIVLVLIRWGNELEASRALVAELGCTDAVVWTPPLSRITLIKVMQAADVVLDQIALPHFGATAPQALAAGTPVISSYKPESTSWIVNQPAPILPAFTAEQVAQAVSVALNPEWRAEFKHRARCWVDEDHHQNRLVGEHLRVYQEILERH